MSNFILLLVNGLFGSSSSLGFGWLDLRGLSLANVDVDVDVNERLSFFGRLYNMDTNPDTGMWYLIITLYVLLIIVYNLGFARKIKFWQSVVIYIVMFIGTLMLAFLGAFYPVGESLIVAAIVLGLYRFRLHRERESGALSLDEKRRQAMEQSKLAAKKMDGKGSEN